MKNERFRKVFRAVFSRRAGAVVNGRVPAGTRLGGFFARMKLRTAPPEGEAHGKQFFGQFAEDACLFSYFADKQYSITQDLSRVGKGFYVDVGAYDPVAISNTRIFYAAGWQGINIDPSSASMESFVRARPRDVNLRCAVSDHEGSITFYGFGHPSVFSTVDREVAVDYAKRLGIEPTVEIVPSSRLSVILESHLPPNTRIDFLSVDAEGHDLQVLQSNDWSRFRPELVVTELHCSELEKVLQSPVVKYMRAVGYAIRFWTPPSVIMVDTAIDGGESIS
jgi:FkbM family methyltransferase